MKHPTILAFDTATELCSAALLRGDECIATEEELGTGAAERILTMIDELLRSQGIGLKDLDAIAFGRGPGGFTGVRLATSVAQGLAFGAGLPVAPVSDLQALAERALALEPDAGQALVCCDARMREVYWALYTRSPQGGSTLIGEERVGAPDSVSVPDASTVVVGVGRGFGVYPTLAARLRPRLGALHDSQLPRAREIAGIGLRDWRGGRTVPAAGALPVYLRDDIARPQR